MSLIPPSISFKIDTGVNSFKPQARSTALPISLNTSGGFSPIFVPGLHFWLDASDINTTVQTAGRVTQWSDKSGNGRNATQSTSSSAPTLSTGFQNGLNTLSFTYSGGFGNCLNMANFTFNPSFVFIVAKINTASSTSGLIFNIQVSPNNPSWRVLTDSGITSLGVDHGGSTKRYFMNPGVNDTNFHIMTFYFFPSADGALWVDGNQGTKTTPAFSFAGDVTAGNPCIGSYNQQPDNSAALNGHVAEIIWYNNLLSSTQRQQIEGYLAWKWGLVSSLPSGHDYKNTNIYAQLQRYGGLPPPSVPLGISIKSWLPTNFGSLTLWLDATALYTIALSAGTTNVTAWGDRSGNNNGATAGTVKPTLSYNAINGLPAIYCNASANVSGLSSPSTASYFTGSTANFTGSYLHTFAVATVSSSSCTFGRILSLARPGVADVAQADTCYPIVRYNGTQYLVNGRWTGTGAVSSIPNYDVPFLAQAYQEPTAEYMSVNGNLTLDSAGSGQGGAFNITAYGVGTAAAANDNVGFHTGFIGEIIYYTRQLTRYEIQTVEGYLAWKWGLQGLLPTGHPFKLCSPPP